MAPFHHGEATGTSLLTGPVCLARAGEPDAPEPATESAAAKSAQKRIRVLLVDDHQMVRDGLGALLGRHPDIDLIGYASRGDEAIRISQELEPDVVVLDVCMPGMHGIEAAERIRALPVGAQVVALSAQGDPLFIQQMALAGARGFVQKDQSADDLVRAIRAVNAGETFFQTGSGQAPESAPLPLSPRERTLLETMAKTSGVRGVAEVMGISVKTAETYRSRIMKKLGFKSQDELLRYVSYLSVRPGLSVTRDGD